MSTWFQLLCTLLFFITMLVGPLRAHGALNLDEKIQIEEEIDSFYDEKRDYTRFSGRVTDRDSSSHMLKVSSENENIKFFRAGDEVQFKLSKKKKGRSCIGYVRSLEEGYFTLYVKDLNPCWDQSDYFRRGTALLFESPTLGKRVKDAALYRVILLRRRKSFFEQLNGINHFLWSYNQKKVQVAAEYDKRIVEIQKQKQEAIKNLLGERQDKIRIQKELMGRLDELDRDLEHYRVENDELHFDRWHLDHDLGKPVGRRPQDLKVQN